MHRSAWLSAAAAMLIAGVAAPASASSEACVALNYLYAQAKADFPKLESVSFDRAECSVVKQEFKCEWGFPSNTFASAEDQASRLIECTEAQTGAKALGKKRGELGFELNPETSVFIRGPEMRSGEWKLRLRILSTADWS